MNVMIHYQHIHIFLILFRILSIGDLLLLLLASHLYAVFIIDTASFGEDEESVGFRFRNSPLHEYGYVMATSLRGAIKPTHTDRHTETHRERGHIDGYRQKETKIENVNRRMRSKHREIDKHTDREKARRMLTRPRESSIQTHGDRSRQTGRERGTTSPQIMNDVA